MFLRVSTILQKDLSGYNAVIECVRLRPALAFAGYAP
jgi:hypothetical protein